MTRKKFRHLSAGLFVMLIAVLVDPVWAHEAAGSIGGFMSGFMHPILGWDHVIAMVAVGIWGAFLGAPGIWTWPIFFPLIMAAGGALGVAGVGLPGVETGIALSAIVLGTMVAAALRPPLWMAVVIVGVFAIFHGHAHSTNCPRPRTLWPTAWALSSRPGCSISPALA